MNFKTTYILAGILAGLVAAFALIRIFGKKPGTELYVMSDMHQAGIKVKDIDTVEIERNRPKKEKIVFVKRGESWRMTVPHDLRVQSYLVDQVVRDIWDAQKEENLDITSNKEQFGLDPPAAVVILKKGNDKEWRLNVGKQSIGDPSKAIVYVTSTSEPDMPMGVLRSKIESLFKSVNDYRPKDLLTTVGSQVVDVKMQVAKHDPLILEKNAEGHWRFQKPAAFGLAEVEGDTSLAGAAAKKITGVRELLNAIDRVRISADADFVAEGVHDWSKYGLDSPRLQITIKRKAGSSHDTGQLLEDSLLVGTKADAKGDKVYARLASENAVVQVSAGDVAPLRLVAEDPAVLRNRDLVDVDRSKVDAINIQNAAGLLKLRRRKDGWKIYDRAGVPSKTDDQAVQDLLTTLTAKRKVSSFPDPGKEAQLGFNNKPLAVVSIWENGIQQEPKTKDKAKEKKADQASKKKHTPKKHNPKVKEVAKKEEIKKTEPEPKLKDEKKPTVQLTFGQKSGNHVNVRRVVGGEKTLLAVPLAILQKVDQGRLAYLDRTLPSFSNPKDVTQLVLDRDGQTYEITRDAKNKDRWRLKQPKEFAALAADSRNVDRSVDDLKFLTTSRLVNEKPSESDLQEYGLKKPRIKATLTVGKEGKKYEYLFGNDTKDGVYAKEGGRDLVFVAHADVIRTLQSELRDRHMFHFESSKVKEIKLTGWKHVYKSFQPVTLDLARQADKHWQVKKGPAAFKLAEDKVETFLKDLTDAAKPLAERFLAGVKPEYKLSSATRMLEVVITTDDGKTITCAIGALDPKSKAYYAQTSTLPKTVFLVRQDRLEKLLAGVEYFSQKAK